MGIQTIDASNAYNCIDCSKTLDIVYKKVPGLYITTFKAHGNPSYVTLDGEINQVEQGAYQGCPMSNTIFNLAISILIDTRLKKEELRNIWFADDGIIYRSPEIVMKAWELIKELGPTIGFYQNNESNIYLRDKGSNKKSRSKPEV